MRSDLCDTCKGIDSHRPFYGPKYSEVGSGIATRIAYQHAASLEDLERSAKHAGCHLCYLMLDVIRKYNELVADSKNVVDDWEHVDMLYDELDDPENGVDAPEALRQLHRDFFREATSAGIEDISDPDAPVLLDITFRKPLRDELASRCIDVAVHWTHTDGSRRTTSALSLISGLPVIQDDVVQLCEARNIENDATTGDPYSSELANLWMQRCDTEHKVCRKRREQRQVMLPTRVIDVSREPPFLFEPPDHLSADYTCLSHCWGKSQQSKTETTSISSRRNAIVVSGMPKTFQDAVAITRNLGIQYLWIDSLCIIQDSAEDWTRESAQMGRIYRDAAVTIFAEFADSDDGGCFMPRTGKDTALCRTPMFDSLARLFTDDSNSSTTSFIQAKLHHSGTGSMPEQHHVFETVRTLDPRSSKPLNSRGWVLQETILSFRSLIHDQHEVRWTCPQMRACECIPEGSTRQSWLERDRTPIKDAENIGNKELFNAWAGIVSEFTKRNLTFGKDKLPAMAGLAAEMAHHKQSLYLAGLWKDSLRENLAWSIPPKSAKAPPRETKKPPAYRAPTWSWASIEGKVTPMFEFSNMHDSKEAHSGRFKRATQLQCEILDCWTKPLSQLNPFGEVHSGQLVLRGRLGRAMCGLPVDTEFHVGRTPIHEMLTGHVLGWLDADVTPASNRDKLDEVWCIPLYNWWSDLRCLALVPAISQKVSKTGADTVYERVGIISARSFTSGTWVDDNTTKTSYIQEDPEAEAANSVLLSWLETAEVETITAI
ncbi:hypothetical protein PMZ80_008046 [Knufia obscura]|uniref:Heterokaryon incompatibility domain-containing protein n=1 Tax=Knufia obscura TaxID=1635080 RepID=A0ABR0RGB8_9EURO|nr:hypothetical protein PMZ80_008046 [Knufia obscura]